MDRAVVQALDGLLPSLSGPLPSELVELATSLLAQSRNQASTLKADEEIARSYACANIACERLKQNLALPKIQPRPPCPPKVYQKLYKYLDAALPAGTRKRGIATGFNDSTSTPTSSPAKSRTPAHIRPDIPKRIPQRRAAAVHEAPVWVMPAIRQLCEKMSTPAAPHHIFAGVSSILSSRDSHHAIAVDIPALIAALHSLVTTRLAGIQMKPAEYSSNMAQSLSILNELARGDVTHKDIKESNVDECIKEIRDREWTEMDWFANIPVGAGLGNSKDEVLDAASDDEEADDVQLLPAKRRKLDRSESADRHYLQAGLGTMMQDRVDYLSDDRRHDYQIWKKAILIRIDELERLDDRAFETS